MGQSKGVSMKQPVDNELEEILHKLANDVEWAIEAQGAIPVNRARENIAIQEAKARLLQWGTRQRIDELNKLSTAKWSDIAYDITGYLKDRTAELQASLKDGGKSE